MELLVVIAIMALLIAMLLPALGRAREVTRRSVCLANLHQMGVGMLTYAQDRQGLLPEEFKVGGFSQPCQVWDRMWTIMKNDYGASAKWFICPSLDVFVPGSGILPRQTTMYDAAGDLALYSAPLGFRVMGYLWLQRMQNLNSGQAPTNVPTSPKSLNDPPDRHLAADFNWQARGAANVGSQWMSHYIVNGGCMIAEGANRLYLDGHAAWANAAIMGANDTPLTPGAAGLWAGVERFDDGVAGLRAYFW